MIRTALLRVTIVLFLVLDARVTVAQPLNSPVLRRIRDTGLVTLGHRVDSAPFSYLDSRRRPIGYSMDICRSIVQAVHRQLGRPDIEVRLVTVTAATRLPMLANGSVDLECGVTTNTA